ncbi:MAG: tRNA pseudouridine55 synthase [Sphingobacteriales bacterium]|jgi:tRNA pseudouridine55 synthase
MHTSEIPEGYIFLIDKPLTWTSFDVVKRMRGITKIKKIGHAGTLDPLATGLLIVCAGKFTKKINTVQDLDKEYTGTMFLGASTPSFDRETEVDNTFDISDLTEEQIMAAVPQFTGEITQYPPIHSAVKIDGQRAYKKARKGIEVKTRPRDVTVNEFKITRIELPEVDFVINCTKGTYIRTIANDFGKALDNGAFLKTLRRTKIGEYNVDDAQTLEELQATYIQPTSEDS